MPPLILTSSHGHLSRVGNLKYFTQKMTVEFLKTVAIGVPMEAQGRIREVRANREAVVEGVLADGHGTVCAVSQGTFRIFSPAVAKRLKIVDDKMLAWFHGLFLGGKGPQNIAASGSPVDGRNSLSYVGQQ